MVENDTFTYDLKKSWYKRADTTVHFLMTHERVQVLDLLIHLIANTTEPTVVCGPEGIGKTSLLRILQQREPRLCRYCAVQGDAGLDFDGVLAHISKAMGPAKSDQYLQTQTPAASAPESQPPKIALIIDDAGVLAPGLMTSIIKYAEKNPVLRVVFALTHDQLHLKYRSDRVVEDCHIVEIPPFTEKQCGDFLQHLSALPSAQMSSNAITDSLIETIYRQTHGIPARIISGFPQLTADRPAENSAKILVIAVAGLIAVALAVQWLSSRNSDQESADSLAVLDRKITDIEIAQPLLTLPVTAPAGKQSNPYLSIDESELLTEQSPGNDSVRENRQAATIAPLAPSNAITISGSMPDANPSAAIPKDTGSTQPFDTVGSSQPERTEAGKPMQQLTQDAVAVDEDSDAAAVSDQQDADWLSSQPPNNYTLQLMVLSKEKSIQAVIGKYPALTPGFRYLRRVFNGKEKFVLLYGSFTSSELANKTRQSLPAEFRKSLTRKIGVVKNEWAPATAN